MKKYVIKRADGREQNVMHAIHDTREGAEIAIREYLEDNNKKYDVWDKRYVSPFDFKLEVVDCKDVNEIITTFERARETLSLHPLMDLDDVKKAFVFPDKIPEDILTLINEFNPHHLDALIALNRLFTIAEAWNKEDGFVPDLSDLEQDKWTPQIEADGMGALQTDVCHHTEAGPYGTRICFKTSKRAWQFGYEFADLFTKFYL